MTNLVIEVFPRRTLRGKRWYFRVKGLNGKTIAQSEGYHNRGDCVGTATLLRARLFDAVMRSE
jgi:hypothetical protein